MATDSDAKCIVVKLVDSGMTSQLGMRQSLSRRDYRPGFWPAVIPAGSSTGGWPAVPEMKSVSRSGAGSVHVASTTDKSIGFVP